jgi:hypothetical protein
MGRINGYLAVKEKFDAQRAKLKQEAKDKYYLNPNICKQCSGVIPYEKRRTSLLFCGHSCSATYSNTKRAKKEKVAFVLDSKKEIVKVLKAESNCLFCEKILNGKANKFCNSKCQQSFLKKRLHEKLDQGIVSGVTTKRIRQYLIEKYGAKCMGVDSAGVQCGWDKINPYTGKCPIELEHIDGNSNNNSFDNLKLLCPSCHSLTPTYKNLNKGNGRHQRRIRYNEGKSY